MRFICKRIYQMTSEEQLAGSSYLSGGKKHYITYKRSISALLFQLLQFESYAYSKILKYFIQAYRSIVDMDFGQTNMTLTCALWTEMVRYNRTVLSFLQTKTMDLGVKTSWSRKFKNCWYQLATRNFLIFYITIPDVVSGVVDTYY